MVYSPIKILTRGSSLVRTIYRFLLVALFGKSSLNGYYDPNIKKAIEKDYIFSSVFPSRDAMERALKTKQNV